MSHAHIFNCPFARDPSAPLGSLQNPYPPGEGPEDDADLGARARSSSSRYVIQTPFFQHVDPRGVVASRLRGPPSLDVNECIYRPHRLRSPSPHHHRTQLLHPPDFPSRPTSPLSPLKRQAFPNVYPSNSNQTRHPPPPPNLPPQPQREPPSLQPRTRHVHFADDEAGDSDARARERRAAVARLNALSTPDPPINASGYEPHPPSRTLSYPAQEPSPSPLGPPQQKPCARVVRSPVRGDAGLRRGHQTPHADLRHHNALHRDASSNHRSRTHYPPHDVHDARRSSMSALDDTSFVNARADYADTITDVLPEPPMWERCAMCGEKPHVIKAKGSLYCRACYGDVCAAERAVPWERCWVCGERPGVHSQGGSRFQGLLWGGVRGGGEAGEGTGEGEVGWGVEWDSQSADVLV